MRLRQTHTYAILEVSPATYREIRAKLLSVDYGHAIQHERGDGEVIDMHGIALRATSCAPEQEIPLCATQSTPTP
jgi:hypothetical protein